MPNVYRVSRGSYEDGMGDYLIGFYLYEVQAYAEANLDKYKIQNVDSIARVQAFLLIYEPAPFFKTLPLATGCASNWIY